MIIEEPLNSSLGSDGYVKRVCQEIGIPAEYYLDEKEDNEYELYS